MESMSFGEALVYWAERTPNNIALSCGNDQRSFAELERRTNRLARWLLDREIGPSNWIGIALPNGTAFIEIIFALAKIGARPVPLSWKAPMAELEAIVDLISPKAIFAGVPSIGGREALTFPGEALAAYDDGALPPQIVSPWAALTSGGSTGRPKIVTLKRPSTADPVNPPHPFRKAETVIIPGPLYHGAPFTYAVRAILAGGHALLMARFDAVEMLELIERHAVDLALAVPTMMHRIWQIPAAQRSQYDLSSLRMFVHMGAPCPAWLKTEFIGWLGAHRLHEFYSTSEQLFMSWITGKEWLDRPGSVGRAIMGQVRVLDDAGRDLAPGQVGELFMMPDGGPGTSYDYIGATAQRNEDGWESTGDLGHLDAEGYLFLSDRRTDMIVTGGANVYPAEVEAAIDEHPDVLASAVIGLPDDEFGARIHAIVQTAAALDDTVMKDWVKQRLVGYKVPRSFEFVTEPLRSEAGKLRRTLLRDARLGMSLAQ